MSYYLVAVSKLFQLLYPSLVWKRQTNKPIIYLTFDDGPTPGVTDWVLKILDKHQIPATFFCIGKNIVEQQKLFNRILERGHRIGNHTQNHINGWKSSSKAYLEDVLEASKHIPERQGKLFRPPYGRIKSSQIQALKKEGYEIIMWTALSADWDQKVSPKDCIKNCLRHSKPGSILVFHDSIKAKRNLSESLESVIVKLKEEGYRFGLL